MFSLPSPPFVHLDQAALIGIPSCVAIYFVFFKFLRPSSSTLPLPPGPKPLPLIGNVLNVPTGSQWRTYTKWAKRYGMRSRTLVQRITQRILCRRNQLVHNIWSNRHRYQFIGRRQRRPHQSFRYLFRSPTIGHGW